VFAKLRVVVTIPEFKEVFEAVGREEVEVVSLLDGRENPHFVDAVPSFIAEVASADVVCAVGLELEIGWLPKVLSKSGNAKVQPGGKGFCEIGDSVHVLERHSGSVDRSMGDVHAGGNPHFHLSPTALKEVSEKVFKVLSQLAPEKTKTFRKNASQFNSKMDALKQSVALKLQALKGLKVIQFHKEFSYFFSEYSLLSLGTIEDKPGVPPSSARISQVALSSKASGVALAIGSFHTPNNYLEKFTEISGIPNIKIPASVQLRDEKLDSIDKVQNFIADHLVQALAVKSVTR